MKYLNLTLSLIAIALSVYSIQSFDSRIQNIIINTKIIPQAIEYNPDEIVNAIDTARAVSKIKNDKQEILGDVQNFKTYSPNVKEGIVLQKGNNNNVVIVYSDFECPVCSKVSPLLEKLKTQNVTIILKSVPLLKHKIGKYSAEQLELLYNKDKSLNYFSVYEFLFKKQDLLLKDSKSFFEQFFKELGNVKIDNSKLGIVQSNLNSYQKEVVNSQINSVPSFNINGNIIVGLPSEEEWDSYLSKLIQ